MSPSKNKPRLPRTENLRSNKPFKGDTPNNKYIENGILDVKVNNAADGESGLVKAAVEAANEQIGDLEDPMFDLVMFCFPPGNNFLAFAYISSKNPFYSNTWCGSVSATMYEIGHNLGFAHSGQLGRKLVRR
jgi:hypothetical protein